jgi:hypothetical protein
MWILSNVVRNWHPYKFYLDVYFLYEEEVQIKNTDIPLIY